MIDPFLTKIILLLNINGLETWLEITFSVLRMLLFCKSTTINLPSEFVKYILVLPIPYPTE